MKIPNPSNMLPIGDVSIFVSDMANARKSVVVDMIMVQVISLFLGSLLLLGFSMATMSQEQMTYTMAACFISFSIGGVVYSRLSARG